MIGRQLVVAACLAVVAAAPCAASEEAYSLLDRELLKVRFSMTNAQSLGTVEEDTAANPLASGTAAADELYQPKSPFKAFLLSLVVPGLGQHYYGSRIKPFAFLGVEALSWFLNVKWNGDADDLTDQFEAFNREHWSEGRYRHYIAEAYGADTIQQHSELQHTLPSTRTQQYYEMTGKYDQFSWGWDDAVLRGYGEDSIYWAAGSEPQFVGGTPPRGTIDWPMSKRRQEYYDMRGEANDKYDQAKSMVFVAMANHVLSAFEAYFVTRSMNNRARKSADELSRVQVRATLRSRYAAVDTPCLIVTYKF